ncbi:hypothetical protein IEQ34_013130 [Dendrobium chrysotoxum]|uniref:Bulb-type lectin domain-containing protein n=1 Tax=Dendrobium chrysotoxum TaxID=161865 RepID=A0AAV7G7H9_DENCH|nr:hypothetical protein IEQ34_013130 [Dendrobium chrysotoxum]
MGANLIAFRYVFLFLMMAVVLMVRFRVTEATEFNHLLPGDTLKNGEKLTEGDYNLIMQPDCNLVLYKENPHEAIWSSRTDGQGNMCEATLTTDGNFAINDKNGTLIDQTGTNKTGTFYVFVLQRNRDVVLYSQAIWSSVTNINDQSSGSNNQAIQLRNYGWLKGLMLLVGSICAILLVLCLIIKVLRKTYNSVDSENSRLGLPSFRGSFNELSFELKVLNTRRILEEENKESWLFPSMDYCKVKNEKSFNAPQTNMGNNRGKVSLRINGLKREISKSLPYRGRRSPRHT